MDPEKTESRVLICPTPGFHRMEYGIILKLDGEEGTVDVVPDNRTESFKLPLDGTSTCVVYDDGGRKIDAPVETAMCYTDQGLMVMLKQDNFQLNESNVAYLTSFKDIHKLEEDRRQYCEKLEKHFEDVEDAITGAKLKTESQLLQIWIVKGPWKERDAVDVTMSTTSAEETNGEEDDAVDVAMSTTSAEETDGEEDDASDVAMMDGEEDDAADVAMSTTAAEVTDGVKTVGVDGVDQLSVESYAPLKAADDRSRIQPAWRFFEDQQKGCPGKVLRVKEVAERVLKDAKAEWKDRASGCRQTQPLLLLSRAGSGKSWTMRQLVYFLARDGRDGHIAFAPLIIVVQRLSSLVRSGTVTLDEDFLRSYIRHEHADFEELLLQLLKLKSLCVILDGIDEASDLRRNIADCVLTHLIASRMQLVVTSRPVGQSRPEYARFFLQIDLAPLTDEQQRQAINEQHADNETFKNLQSFSDLRRKHDDMYYRYSEEHRAEIEAVSGPTEKPRQRHNNPLQEANKISSTYLEKINAELTREEDGISVLTKLGFAVKEFQSPDEASNNDASGRRERVKELAKSLSALVHKKPTKIVVERLLEFIIKCREDEDKRSASELWLDVWQTSDQLYVVAESCQKGWDEWFDMIKKSEVECQIEPAPTLKDPIRVYEKVKNDYMGLMGGNDSPVSFVTDVIRARVFFTRLDELLGFVLKLLSGKKNEINLKIKVVRLKVRLPTKAPVFMLTFPRAFRRTSLQTPEPRDFDPCSSI